MLESQEYRSILVGVDGSDQSELAFKKAIAVAKRNEAKVVVAYIMENNVYGGTMSFSTYTPDLLEEQAKQAEERLKTYIKKAKQLGYENVKTVLEFGSPKVLMARDLPEKHHTDLIMLGQSGLNTVERFVMGSVSDYVIRTAPCDVLVVRAE